jgi:uncharacterized membrane protein (DUF485 family)
MMIENIYKWAFILMALSFVFSWIYFTTVKKKKYNGSVVGMVSLVTGLNALLAGSDSMKNDTFSLLVGICALGVACVLPIIYLENAKER